MTPVIALLVLILAMMVGIPIPLSFLVSAGYICLVGGYNPLMLFTYGFNNQNSIILLTIPLFILAGAIIDKGGIGEKLISGLQKMGKGSRAGLGTITIIACAVFGAVSGSGDLFVHRLHHDAAPEGKGLQSGPHRRAARVLRCPGHHDPAVHSHDPVRLGHGDLGPGLLPGDHRARHSPRDSLQPDQRMDAEA